MSETIGQFRNNCVLVMIKEITNRPDVEVLAAVRKRGYKNNHGMFTPDYTNALYDLGIKLGPTQYGFTLDRVAGVRNYKRFTLNRALRHMRQGVWLCNTQGHVLVVRNGTVVDHNFRSRSALARGVMSITPVLNAYVPAKRGVLRMVRNSTRKFGTGTWHRFNEAKQYLAEHKDVTRKQLLAATTYDAIDLAWDLKRGNIVEE